MLASFDLKLGLYLIFQQQRVEENNNKLFYLLNHVFIINTIASLSSDRQFVCTRFTWGSTCTERNH